MRTRGVELSGRWRPHRAVAVDAEATYLDAKDLDGGGVSGYFDEQIPVPARDTVAGYGLLGFAGSWRFRDGFTLRPRLDNLTDRAYETFIGFPGPGRSFWAGLGWDRP